MCNSCAVKAASREIARVLIVLTKVRMQDDNGKREYAAVRLAVFTMRSYCEAFLTLEAGVEEARKEWGDNITQYAAWTTVNFQQEELKTVAGHWPCSNLKLQQLYNTHQDGISVFVYWVVADSGQSTDYLILSFPKIEMPTQAEAKEGVQASDLVAGKKTVIIRLQADADAKEQQLAQFGLDQYREVFPVS